MRGKEGPLRTWKTAAVICAALLVAASCHAQDLCPDGRTHGCPPSAYSRFHYWTPNLVRVWEHCKNYSVKCNGPVLYPEIVGDVRIIRYKCVPVDPSSQPYGVMPPPGMVIPVARYGTIPPVRITAAAP